MNHQKGKKQKKRKENNFNLRSNIRGSEKKEVGARVLALILGFVDDEDPQKGDEEEERKYDRKCDGR